MKRIPIIIYCFCLLGLSACSTEYNLATKQQETLMYGTDKEVAMGDGVSRQIEAHYKLLNDVDANERVHKILDRLTAVCDRKDLVYTIKIIDDDVVNAVSLPGGYIYVFRGLIDKITRDDQLAGVIGHELGHITAKHALKRLQAMYGYAILQVAAVSSGSGGLARGVSAIYSTLFFAYSQEDELQADALGVKYTRLAGYDPKAMIEVLKILEKEEGKGGAKPISYFRTHPYIPERMAVVNKEITGSLDFRGYLNLTGNEK